MQALREQLRCKEIWVAGADATVIPDEDLPADFGADRDAHYAALGLPRDAEAFIARLRAEMTGGARQALDRGLADNPHVRILERGGGRVALAPLERQAEPEGLGRAQGRDRPALADDQPAGHAQGGRPADRLHRRLPHGD